MVQFPQYTEEQLLHKRIGRFRWLEQEARAMRRERVIDSTRASILANSEKRQEWITKYERGELWPD